MPYPPSEINWFKKETGVYYTFFWMSPGLVLVWLAMNLFIKIEVAVGVAVFLFYIIPYVLFFISGILGVWGVSLVVFGLWNKERVGLLTIAAITSMTPFLLCSGALIVGMFVG